MNLNGTRAANPVVVGISDCAVSSDTSATLITYALGSCVAVAVWDPAVRAGGLVHVILPDSALSAEKAAQNPWMFADTAVPKMLAELAKRGVNTKRSVVRLAGGAQVMDRQGVFNIGKKNLLAVRKVLWKEGILVSGEAVGGDVARTVRLEIGSGAFFIREDGRGEWDLGSKGGPR